MDYNYEQNLIAKGYQTICGIDEAGRGSLAGPLVAGAVVLDPNNTNLFVLLNDSKLLSEIKRDEIFAEILKGVRAWAVGLASSFEIDKHGLAFANKIAMKRAWKHLSIKPDFIVSDYLAKLHFETPFELVVKGDRKVASVAAASIVAKVLRDRMMLAFHNKYPDYCFNVHKGYGTKLHMEKINEFGICDIHRKSYAPIKAKLF